MRRSDRTNSSCQPTLSLDASSTRSSSAPAIRSWSLNPESGDTGGLITDWKSGDPEIAKLRILDGMLASPVPTTAQRLHASSLFTITTPPLGPRPIAPSSPRGILAATLPPPLAPFPTLATSFDWLFDDAAVTKAAVPHPAHDMESINKEGKQPIEARWQQEAHFSDMAEDLRDDDMELASDDHRPRASTMLDGGAARQQPLTQVGTTKMSFGNDGPRTTKHFHASIGSHSNLGPSMVVAALIALLGLLSYFVRIFCCPVRIIDDARGRPKRLSTTDTDADGF